MDDEKVRKEYRHIKELSNIAYTEHGKTILELLLELALQEEDRKKLLLSFITDIYEVEKKINLPQILSKLEEHHLRLYAYTTSQVQKAAYVQLTKYCGTNVAKICEMIYDYKSSLKGATG